MKNHSHHQPTTPDRQNSISTPPSLSPLSIHSPAEKSPTRWLDSLTHALKSNKSGHRSINNNKKNNSTSSSKRTISPATIPHNRITKKSTTTKPSSLGRRDAMGIQSPRKSRVATSKPQVYFTDEQVAECLRVRAEYHTLGLEKEMVEWENKIAAEWVSRRLGGLKLVAGKSVMRTCGGDGEDGDGGDDEEREAVVIERGPEVAGVLLHEDADGEDMEMV